MGFGFNLFFFPALLLITIIGLVAWAITKKSLFGKILGIIWLTLIGLIILLLVVQKLTSKKILKKESYYGQYVIDRSFFPGKQANWQYKHFYFDIKPNDSIYLYVVYNDKITKTYKGVISTMAIYKSERLAIHMEHPTHHILTSNPTTYRGSWSFYLVFNSPKFGNMYFVKDNWSSDN
ncbi:hypothetical protein GM921_08270 [Pedobacter sp. LMG 31464]|uniref:Uncharacterized protein n=1 Tax=Pedobacter planticolens TaxID=2679964 RepID=A0A923DWU8_9SPHI|nr:hypothetical protein [Pedobacter planticolens]MBB2145474.1 hypothetical protein [Pedobacter planticolens]